MNGLGKIAATVLAHAPDVGQLVAEGEAEFNAIAHGEGGAAKIKNALAGAQALAATLEKLFASL